MFILGLVKFVVLYYNSTAAQTFRAKSELVTDAQFHNFVAQYSFGVIEKTFSYDHGKIWGFHPA